MNKPLDIGQRQDHLRKLLKAAFVVPVLTIERVADAVPLARALVAGGIRTLEITLRTDAAVEAAKAVIAEVPEAIVGIGTVLTPADFQKAYAIGARFTVSPGATRELLDIAASSDLPFLPGVATASELMQARERGFNTLKFFPAEQAGGIAMLRAWAGPFPDVRILPDGRDRRGQCGELAQRADGSGGRRVLDLSVVNGTFRRLGRHNGHVRADHENPASAMKPGY